MPSSVNEEYSSNDEPEAEAHCNQKMPSQNVETEQAANQEPEERTSPSYPANQREGNQATNSTQPRSLPARSSTPVLEAAQSLSLRESEDIAEAMTFSDAEEDQPNKKENSLNANETPNNENEIQEADTSPSTLACSSNSNEACALPQRSTSSGYHTITDDKDSHPESTCETNEDLDSEKVMEKLQQIQGYINQTTTAMKTLEKDGSASKREQYKTLGKVMKDLEASKEKLVTRLVALEDKYNAEELADLNQEQGSSQRVGVVGSMNEVVNPLSMKERLARHETEQGVLSSRLRESVAKRQELVARYKNTRERLSTLKQQRQGLIQEERSLLQADGAPEDPYSESIPEALTWSVDQLKQSYVEFEELKNKVVHLHSLYETQANNIDQNDEEAQANIRRKKEQIDLKRLQVNGVLAQLRTLLEKKGAVPGTAADASDEDVAADALSGAVAVGEALSASTSEVLASSDVAAKQEHLNKLKNQLNSMKRLLDETQSIRLSNIADIEQHRQFDEPLKPVELIQPPEPERREIEVLSFNSQFHRLTAEQQAHPEIYAKSQQILQAKQRLAKMEDVMAMITVAREQGKPLHEVLTPEYMTILEDAQNELENPTDSSKNADESAPVASTPPQQSSIAKAPARSDPESDHEITAMEIEPQRNLSTFRPPEPEPPATTNVKEADSSNHNRNIWNDTTTPTEELNASPPSDPRVFELRNLQHELCRKKDTLEALMSSVGKSSSAFFADNSDNISVNVSDGNSEEPAEEPVSRSWNDVSQTNCFKNEAPHPTERDLAMSLNAGLTMRETPTAGPKNRNKLASTQRGSRPASGFALPPSATINNFSVPQGVRPKSHPYDMNKRTPNVTWETTPPAQKTSSNENSQEDVQKMMTQLNGLQQTVNHLCDSIRQSKPPQLEDRMGYPVMPTGYPPYQMYPGYFPPMNVQGMYGGPFPYNYDQRNSDVNTTGHMMNTLQQCLSQLHLNTMEIQALGKQLQMVGEKEKSGGENYATNRDNPVADNPFRLDRTDSPSASFRFNECISSVMRDDRPTSVPTPSYSQPPPPPLSFRRANNLHDLDLGNQNLYPPFDERVSDGLLNRTRGMGVAGSSYGSNPLAQATKNILNNKVLPGSRANNYWDNFRSYSHQNPLSSTRKSNSRWENFSGPMHPDSRNVSRAKDPIQAYPNRLHENRRQNVTARDRNVNRASEKNSSYGNKRVSQGRGNFSPPVIVPEPQYTAVRRAKNENRREETFLQPTTTEAPGFIPNFPNSNLHARTFDEYLAARDLRRDDKGPPQESRSAVMRQAEFLLQKQHPKFLLKLFSYLSKITDNTDQHVALELLKELSNQDASFHNRWVSSASSLNTDDYFQPLVSNRRQINKNEASSIERTERNAFSAITDADLSEGFQCAGDDLQAKEIYDVVKNLAAVEVDHRPDRSSAVEDGLNQINSSNNSSFYTPVDQTDNSLWKRSKDHVNFFDTSRRAKDKSPELSAIGGLDLMPSTVEYKNLCAAVCPPQSPSPRHRTVKKSTSAGVSAKSHNHPSNGHSASGHAYARKCPTPPPEWYSDDHDSDAITTFDGVVTAVFNKVVDRIKSAPNAFDTSDRFLDKLHVTLMGIIQSHGVKRYPADFFTLMETKLRMALHNFKGRRICQIEQELPTAVSSVLINLYSMYHYSDNTEASATAFIPDSPEEANSQSNLRRPQPPTVTNAHGYKKAAGRRTSAKTEDPFRVRRPVDVTDQQLNGFWKSTRPQMWTHSAAASNPGTSLASPMGDEPEGSFIFRPNPEVGKAQWNNAPAVAENDDAARNARGESARIFSTIIGKMTSLPVHDLAEADQSRDKPSLEMDESNLNEVSAINGHQYDTFDLATGFNTGHRAKKSPSQCLDEVPTKLRSPSPVNGFDEEDEVLEPFEELSFRRAHSP